MRSAEVGEPWILQLAKYGYDVWLGNSRGTKYSDKSFNDPQDEKERWAFTMHQMAIYDLQAELRTIEEETGSKLVTYLGLGQGSFLMLYALALLEESFFAERLYKFVALAPCFYIETAFKSKLQLLDAFQSAYEKQVYWTTRPVGAYTDETPDGQPMSVAAQLYYNQIAIEDKFMEY